MKIGNISIGEVIDVGVTQHNQFYYCAAYGGIRNSLAQYNENITYLQPDSIYQTMPSSETNIVGQAQAYMSRRSVAKDFDTNVQYMSPGTSYGYGTKQQSEDAMKTEREIASREAEKDASTIAGPTGGSQRTRSGQSPRGGRGTVGYTQADTSSPTMSVPTDPSEVAAYNAAAANADAAASDFAGAAEAGGTGDVGEFGAPGQDEGPTGATAGDYGYFNKGGLAGKKPKKKMKTYKKGGLATSKK